MYASLGQVTCLTPAQLAEANRLCNCQRFGLPSDPSVKGLGALSIDLTKYSTDDCDPSLRVPMPPDFDPSNPCEGAMRSQCGGGGLTRPTGPAKSSPLPPTEYEEEVVSSAVGRQRVVVFGVLGAVLVGGGYLVYRSLRS